MIKTVLSSSLLVGLCATASAAPPTSSYQVNLSVRPDGKDVRSYSVRVTEQDCGSIKAKLDTVQDEIQVCSDELQGTKFRMRISWILRTGKQELQQSSAIIVERGTKFELDSGVAKLAVTIQ